MGEKRLQIMVMTRALAAVALFKRISNPPRTETAKVVMMIQEAYGMDPDLFSLHRDESLVRDALDFLREYGG